MSRRALLASIAILVAAPLHAQRVADRALTLAAGAMAFDASGTGSATVFCLGVHQTLPWRWVALEASAIYAGLDEQFATSPTRLGIAELQAQVQWPALRVRPYVGVGGGFARYFTNRGARDPVEPAVGVGAGVRAGISEAWGLRFDARIRGWQFADATDWAVNTSGEVSAGVSRRF